MTVVVGIKGKQPTALRFAAAEAVRQRSFLRIVHCLDRRTAADFVSVPFNTFPPASWRATGEALIEDARTFVEGLDESPDVECVLVDGLPLPSLRDESSAASMLVLGVDEAGWDASPIFGGSVTERLLSHATMPVAIIPERSWTGELDGPVFVGIDNRTPAEGPLRFAFMEASRTKDELHVAHIIPEGDTGVRSELHHVGVSEVVAGWCAEFPDVTVRHRFFYDEAGDGCVRVSEEASLLVLGRRKSQIFGHPVLGQIAKRVHCPCVVVPDQWAGR